jgi:hypothetical protein
LPPNRCWRTFSPAPAGPVSEPAMPLPVTKFEKTVLSVLALLIVLGLIGLAVL